MKDKKEIESGEFTYGDTGYGGEFEVFLPHSCDEWIIGSVEDFEQFLKDGEELLRKIKQSI